MNSRRSFLKTAGLGLTGILIGTSCHIPKKIKLPNGYATKGFTRSSRKFPGSEIIFSKEDNLEERSRVKAKIINTKYNFNQISLQLETPGSNIKRYTFQIKNLNGAEHTSFLLNKIHQEGIISIPTIRKYEYVGAPGHKFDYIGYRELREMDNLHAEEIMF